MVPQPKLHKDARIKLFQNYIPAMLLLNNNALSYKCKIEDSYSKKELKFLMKGTNNINLNFEKLVLKYLHINGLICDVTQYCTSKMELYPNSFYLVPNRTSKLYIYELFLNQTEDLHSKNFSLQFLNSKPFKNFQLIFKV